MTNHEEFYTFKNCTIDTVFNKSENCLRYPELEDDCFPYNEIFSYIMGISICILIPIGSLGNLFAVCAFANATRKKM